jgi:hypothetical protein
MRVDCRSPPPRGGRAEVPRTRRRTFHALIRYRYEVRNRTHEPLPPSPRCLPLRHRRHAAGVACMRRRRDETPGDARYRGLGVRELGGTCRFGLRGLRRVGVIRSRHIEPELGAHRGQCASAPDVREHRLRQVRRQDVRQARSSLREEQRLSVGPRYDPRVFVERGHVHQIGDPAHGREAEEARGGVRSVREEGDLFEGVQGKVPVGPSGRDSCCDSPGGALTRERRWRPRRP